MLKSRTTFRKIKNPALGAISEARHELQLANNSYFSVMRALYNFLTHIAYFHLLVAQWFSKKLTLFVQGRKEAFAKLSKEISPTEKYIWFHCASLGEFEQGVPLMEALKKEYPNHKLLVTFFSPSGYEIKKDNRLAAVTTYLPFDTKANARRFVSLVKPQLAIFIKYEIWPNYLRELKTQHIPTVLVSGLFRKNQIFFKSYGSFMRSALQSFDHFFVQDATSKDLLEKINLQNITVSGDTRFDRVSNQIEQNNHLDFIDAFKGDSLCVVCGSTWPEDEAILLPFINTASHPIKWVIAPHKIDATAIAEFRANLKKESVLYSAFSSEGISQEAQVLVVDSIGLLTKIYSYADVAYVGGAMGTTGLHNILEPATFGVPIVIGNRFNNFPEAKRLQQLAGLFSVASSEECSEVLEKLLTDQNFRSKTGMIAGHFVNSNTGATRIISDYIATSYGNRFI